MVKEWGQGNAAETDLRSDVTSSADFLLQPCAFAQEDHDHWFPKTDKSAVAFLLPGCCACRFNELELDCGRRDQSPRSQPDLSLLDWHQGARVPGEQRGPRQAP